VSTNDASLPTRRTFAIVFDDLRVGDLDTEEVERAVETFVERDVRSGDRLVVFATSDGRDWSTTRGGEDDAFVRALRRVRSHERKADPFRPFPVMHYEAMQIEEAGDESVLGLVQRRPGVCKGSAFRRRPFRRRPPFRRWPPFGSGGPAQQTGGQDEPPVRHCFDAAEIYTLERGRLASTLRDREGADPQPRTDGRPEVARAGHNRVPRRSNAERLPRGPRPRRSGERRLDVP
jgi:hypothetical protein